MSSSGAAQVITPGMAPSNQSKQITTVTQAELVEEKSGNDEAPEGNNKNNKGIVEAKFLEDIPGFVRNREVPDCVAALQDFHSRFKYLEHQLNAQLSGLK